MTMSVRRVVTGHDSDARAVVATDELLELRERPGRRGAQSCEIWSTNAMPVDLSDEAAAAQRRGFVERFNYVGSGQGSVLRILALDADANRFMHRTETLDYAIVLSGECDLELDDGLTTHLSAGDVVVQRGTIHAWVNTGREPCVFAFVLLDASPAVVGDTTLEADYPVH